MENIINNCLLENINNCCLLEFIETKYNSQYNINQHHINFNETNNLINCNTNNQSKHDHFLWYLKINKLIKHQENNYVLFTNKNTNLFRLDNNFYSSVKKPEFKFNTNNISIKYSSNLFNKNKELFDLLCYNIKSQKYKSEYAKQKQNSNKIIYMFLTYKLSNKQNKHAMKECINNSSDNKTKSFMFSPRIINDKCETYKELIIYLLINIENSNFLDILYTNNNCTNDELFKTFYHVYKCIPNEHNKTQSYIIGCSDYIGIKIVGTEGHYNIHVSNTLKIEFNNKEKKFHMYPYFKCDIICKDTTNYSILEQIIDDNKSNNIIKNIDNVRLIKTKEKTKETLNVGCNLDIIDIYIYLSCDDKIELFKNNNKYIINYIKKC